jgi:hypothetical protein
MPNYGWIHQLCRFLGWVCYMDVWQWLLLSIISLPSPLGNSLDVMNLYRKRSSQCCRPLESLTPWPQTERNRPLHTDHAKRHLRCRCGSKVRRGRLPQSLSQSLQGALMNGLRPLPGQLSWTKCPPGRGVPLQGETMNGLRPLPDPINQRDDGQKCRSGRGVQPPCIRKHAVFYNANDAISRAGLALFLPVRSQY